MRRALSASAQGLRTDGDREAALLLARAFARAQEADPRQLTHGFHSYPARFHPVLVRTLLAARAKPGMTVCDPFCGSGTTLVEALLAGCRGVGSDLNPLALELARIKALAPTDAHRRLPDELLERTKQIGEASWARVKARTRTKSSGEQWDDPTMYAPHVFRELVGLRELIDAPPGGPVGALLRRAMLLCFSSLLIKVSRQSSETAPGLQERTIGKGLASRLFQRKAEELVKGLRDLWELVPPGAPSPLVQKGDARRLKHVADASVDLIVTSPPYLGTYDYADHHIRRLGWLELNDTALRDNELGSRRKAEERSAIPEIAVAMWQTELDQAVAAMARVLRPEGYAFVVMGDSHIGKKGIQGDHALRIAADRAALVVHATAAELRKANGPASEEHLIELRHKPA